MEKRAVEALAKLDAAAAGEKRFYALPDASAGAVHLERFALASQLANEALESSKAFTKNWNYGNAIHRAHIVLGLVALHEGDTDLAVREHNDEGTHPCSQLIKSYAAS
jgi:hypothetical protein